MAPSSRTRAYVACVFVAGTGAIFFLSAVTPLPVPLYLPLLRSFAMTAPPAELSMDYYGRSLLALLVGGILALLTALIHPRLAPRLAQRMPESPSRPTLLLFLSYAATALLLCVALYGYQLYGREVLPEPLPSWYQPK